jgi:hypothetical protein
MANGKKLGLKFGPKPTKKEVRKSNRHIKSLRKKGANKLLKKGSKASKKALKQVYKKR